MLNTQKISSNISKLQNLNNEFINEHINNEDNWCDLKINNNIFFDYDIENENINRESYMNNVNSCKHLYSNVFNISNIPNMNDRKNNIINNYNEINNMKLKKNNDVNDVNDDNIENNFNKFEYIKSINKIIFYNNNNIIFGEFTLYQFIKYLIKNIDRNNLFIRNITLNSNNLYFIENNICTTLSKSNTNICIKLVTSSIMENIDFLFLFNNLVYSYKINDLLNDLENVEDVIQNKIIVVFDQFIYLLINHTLKIILAKSLHCKNNDQYDKMSSLLIYRMSKLVHSQLMTHIQMNINITNYLNMIKEIHNDFSKKIKNELGIKNKKKSVNIFTDSSFDKLNNINKSSSDKSISSSSSLNEIFSSKLTSDKDTGEKNKISSSDDLTSLNNNILNNTLSNKSISETLNNNTNVVNNINMNEKIIGNKNISSIKDKINFDLDKILSEITS